MHKFAVRKIVLFYCPFQMHHFPVPTTKRSFTALALLVILLASKVTKTEAKSLFLDKLESSHIRHIQKVDVNLPAQPNPAGQLAVVVSSASRPPRRRRRPRRDRHN